MLSEVQAADAYCRYLAKRHYENFSVVSILLPSEIRLHLARIYAFCRTTDDLGDEQVRVRRITGDLGVAASHARDRLTHWRTLVQDVFDDNRAAPIHPVLLALAATIARFDLPRQPYLDLVDANLQDQRVSSYETWEDLRAYCMLSAAPVGRMVLGVFEVADSAGLSLGSTTAVRLSDDVCIGLQLANFAQDVAVDRAKGRTYLLQSDLRAAGTEGAVRRMCERAERLLAAGEELERMVPATLRLQLALYRLGGMAILSAIERTGYGTDHVRPTVSLFTKARLVSLALAQSTRGERDVEKLRTPAT